jgi:hypothetical protein
MKPIDKRKKSEKKAAKKEVPKKIEVKRAIVTEIPPELKEPEQGKGPRVNY